VTIVEEAVSRAGSHGAGRVIYTFVLFETALLDLLLLNASLPEVMTEVASRAINVV